MEDVRMTNEFDTQGNLALKQKKPMRNTISLNEVGVKETVAKAIEYSREMNIHRNEIHDQIGIHWRTWESLRYSAFENIQKKTYEKLKEFNRKMERRLNKRELEGNIKQFIETENVRKIRLTLIDCFRNFREGLYIVLGPSGSGKTFALRVVMGEIQKNKDYDEWRIINIHCHEHHTAKSLLLEIAEEIGLNVKRERTIARIIQRLSMEMKAQQTAIIFDEADWLMNRHKLNLLRILWDKAPFACYLLGVDDIIDNFYRNHVGNRQLMGRIYGFTRLNNLKMDDVFKFFNGCNLQTVVMERIYVLTGGNAHLVRKMLKKIKMLSLSGINVSEETVEDIFKNLMFVGQF